MFSFCQLGLCSAYKGQSLAQVKAPRSAYTQVKAWLLDEAEGQTSPGHCSIYRSKKKIKIPDF